MANTFNHLRVIVEFICGLVLITLFFGVMLIAAIQVGWLMAIGMLIAFGAEILHRIKYNS